MSTTTPPTTPDEAQEKRQQNQPEQSQSNSGIKRSNKMPVLIFVLIIGFVVCVISWIGLGKTKTSTGNQKTATAQKQWTGRANELATPDSIMDGYTRVGMVPETQITTKPIVSKPLTREQITVPAIDDANSADLDASNDANFAASQMDSQMRQQMQQVKMQLFEKAVAAPTSVSFDVKQVQQSFSGLPSRNEMLDKIEQIKQNIAAQQAGGGASSFVSKMNLLKEGLAQNNSQPSAQNSASSNLSVAVSAPAGVNGKWQLESKMRTPSKYEILAGTVLPATLISGINSELPGQISAQVSQDVYDSATGKYLLVPQGAKLIGQYSSDVSYGQARVMIGWQRIEFPDGKALDIGHMPGADSSGYSGFKDQVDNHYFRIFGSALLMSSVTAGVAYSQSRSSAAGMYQPPTMSDEMSQALGQQLGQVTAQMVQKNMNISPTIKIRPGYRFNVITTKDMTFGQAYKAFDYATKRKEQ